MPVRLPRTTALLVATLLLGAGCATPEAEQEDLRQDRPAPTTGPGTPTATPPATPPATSPSDLPLPLARALRQAPPAAVRPSVVVAQIVAAEDAIADPAVPADVLAAAGHLQQVAYRQLARRPGWDAAVRAAVPPRMRALVDRNVASRREFIALQGGAVNDTVPPWRIIRPESPRALLRHYLEAEAQFGVDWEYLAAINLVETGMGRIRGDSVAAARGPMQFIPATWAQYGEGDINDPRDAILAAGRYLSARGFTEFGGVPGALFAYNNSERYVRGVTRLAEVMQQHPRAYLGYYHWQVYYVSTRGDLLLPQGYAETRRVPVDAYLARS